MDQHKFSLAPLQLPLLWLRIIIVSTHLLCGTLGQQIDVLIVGIVMVFGGLHRGCPVGLGRRLGLQIERGGMRRWGLFQDLKWANHVKKSFSCGQSLQLIVMAVVAGGWLMASGVSIGLLCVRDHHHHRLPLLNDQHSF